MAGKLTTAQVDDLIERYRAGESQNQLAASFGITQSSVGRWIKVRGARISRSEAEARKWAAMSAAERAVQVSHAHDAVRGMKRTPEDLARRALGKQRTQAHATDQELALAALVTDAGRVVVTQQAVGPYNLDLAVDGAVAVELFGGGWHAHGGHLDRLPERTYHLADAGWNLLVVWCLTPQTVDLAALAHDVHAYAERTSGHPAFRRQYRVIWGDGKFYAGGSVDDDEVALVPTAVSRFWRWPGR